MHASADNHGINKSTGASASITQKNRGLGVSAALVSCSAHSRVGCLSASAWRNDSRKVGLVAHGAAPPRALR